MCWFFLVFSHSNICLLCDPLLVSLWLFALSLCVSRFVNQCYASVLSALVYYYRRSSVIVCVILGFEDVDLLLFPR